MNMTKRLLLLALVAVWSLQCAMFTAAWPLASQEDEEDDDGDDSLRDPEPFEGDILITPKEIMEHYGGPYNEELIEQVIIAVV